MVLPDPPVFLFLVSLPEAVNVPSLLLLVIRITCLQVLPDPPVFLFLVSLPEAVNVLSLLLLVIRITCLQVVQMEFKKGRETMLRTATNMAAIL